jgi:hypothetical protein
MINSSISISTGGVKYCSFDKLSDEFKINNILDVAVNLSLIVEKKIRPNSNSS